MNNPGLIYLGSFRVDSGQAVIGDPCYLDGWQAKYENFDDYKNRSGEYGYLGSCHATLTNGYGVLGQGEAVAVTTGYGDGHYPVYAEFNEDGRISRVVIEFIEMEDEEGLEIEPFSEDTPYTDYPFTSNGVRFLSRVFFNSPLIEKISSMGTKEFARLNHETMMDVIGNASLFSHDDLLSKLKVVNKDATHNLVLLNEG